MKTGTALLLVAGALALSSCAGMKNLKDSATRPVTAQDMSVRQQEAISKLQMDSTPAVVQVEIPKEAFRLTDPSEIQRDTQIDVEFADASLNDILVGCTRTINANIVYEHNTGTVKQVQGDQQAQQIQAPAVRTASIKFKGPLRDFFKILSKMTGYFFIYEDGTIYVKNECNFSVMVPNYQDLLKQIEANLAGNGAYDVTYDSLTSILTFKADYKGFVKAREYLQALKENASLVTLRVVMLDVKLNGEKNLGVDWTKLVFGMRSQKPSNIGLGKSDDSSNNNGSSGSGTDTVKKLFNDGVSIAGNSTGANLVIESSKFVLSTFLDYIESYGQSKILQNIFIETLSGSEGKIEVLTETPYVSQIAVTALSNQTSQLSQAAQTEKAKSGVEMKILPLYNKRTGTLNIQLNAGVFGVTRFINLTAGTLGNLTQPETTKKTVSTNLRMTPDQVAVIGGLIFDKTDDTTKGLPVDSLLTKTTGKNSEKEELVIVVKPTIIEFI